MGGHPAADGATGTLGAQPHRRFEYKYSFKGPHLVQSDGTVPFWAHAGSKPGQRSGGPGPLSALSRLLFTFSPCTPYARWRGPFSAASPARRLWSARFPPPAPQSFPHSLHSTFLLPSLMSSVLSVWARGFSLVPALPSTHLSSLLGITSHPNATSPPNLRPGLAALHLLSRSPSALPCFFSSVLAVGNAPVCTRCPLTASEVACVGFRIIFKSLCRRTVFSPSWNCTLSLLFSVTWCGL